MDIRSFFGKASSSKSTTKEDVTPAKHHEVGSKSKKKSVTTPEVKVKSKSSKEKKTNKSPTLVIDDSDSDEFTSLGKGAKHGNNKTTPKIKSKDKNGNVSKSSEKKKGRARFEESSDEEPIQKSKKSKGSFKKGNIIFDSDSEDPIPDSPEPIKKRGTKRKSATIFDDSDDDHAEGPNIMDSLKKKPSKQGITPAKAKGITPAKTKAPSPPKTAVSVTDFFGVETVKRKDNPSSTVKRKPKSSPAKTENDDFEMHDDDDFEETLRQLDSKHEPPSKKLRIEATPPKESNGQTLASKLAAKSKKVEILAVETPQRKSPKKISPKKTPSPGKVKIEVTKRTPAPSPLNESDVDSAKKPARNVNYRSYMQRDGPQSLGSKEVPEGGENCLEGLTFVITGVLESFERDEAKSIIERYGGKVTGNVSKKTSYVIVGRDPGESKTNKATQMKVKQIDEDAMLDLIRKLPGKKSKYEIAAELEAKNAKKSLPLSKKHSASPSVSSRPSPASAKIAGTPCGSPGGAASQDSTASSQVSLSASMGESLLWVDKYKPTSLKQIIGQQGDKSNARKLLHWLTHWHRSIASGKKPAFNRFSDDGSGFRAALLSGPPGVGKTTTAQLVCKEVGFSYVELNASDTRSKKSLQTEVAESLNNHTLTDFLGTGNKSGGRDGQQHCLLMDEVDGMAGNEDRGGIQEMVQLIKTSKIPIICMCNDRNHPKMRTLSNYCFDLRFQRPRLEQIKAAMMSMSFKEGIKIPPPALSDIIQAANQDIRQVIHNLSMWSVKDKNLSHDQIKEDALKAKKDLKVGPFDVVRKVFAMGEETAKMSIADKSDLFFHDYSFGPLFVQENYINVTPASARGDMKKHLRLLSRAADSIAQGDLVDRHVRAKGQWNMLPVQAIYASVIPGEMMRGGMGGQIQFPSWLGKNSSRNKNDRLLQELRNHTRLKVSANKRGLNQEYVPQLRRRLTAPLIQHGQEGVPEIIKLLDEYDLVREDFDSLLELSQWPGMKDPLSNVEPKVKAAFTRAYNKESHRTPYATGAAPKKGRGRGGGGETDMEGMEGDGEESQTVNDEDKKSDEEMDVDTMIKKKKVKAAAARGRGTSDSSRGKGKGPGKGRGKGRGK